MCLMEELPFCLALFYKFIGIVQFSCKNTSSTFSRYLPRFWSVPVCALHFSCYYFWLTSTYFDKKNLTATFQKVDMVASVVSSFTMITSIVIFKWRSNKLKFLLLKLKDIQTTLSPETHKQRLNWFEIIFIVTGVVNFIAIIYIYDYSSVILFSTYLSAGVSSFDHLFLNNVLKSIRNQFDSINQSLQTEVQRVAFHKTFSLNGARKVEKLDIGHNIRRIQELSLHHLDLVNLSLDVSKLFDITTIVSTIMLFGYIIDTVYIFLLDVINGTKGDSTLVLVLPFLGLNILFYFLWVCLMVGMYSCTQERVTFRFNSKCL
jgi:hypothetical protein